MAAGGGGRKHTEETKRKIGLAQKGKTLSEETRKKISLAHKGLRLSTETRLKIKAQYWNTPKRQAMKRQMEERQARIIIERQQRQKAIAARQELMKSIKAYLHTHAGRKSLSEESRRRISQAQKGRTAWNKGIKAWNNGLRWPEEVKENISRGMVVYWIRRKEGNNLKCLQ